MKSSPNTKPNADTQTVTATTAAELAAVVAAFQSATREEQLVLNGVMLGMAAQRSVNDQAG